MFKSTVVADSVFSVVVVFSAVSGDIDVVVVFTAGNSYRKNRTDWQKLPPSSPFDWIA